MGFFLATSIVISAAHCSSAGPGPGIEPTREGLGDPVLLCALWHPPTNRWSALAGMLGGFLTTMLWVLWFKAITHDLMEIIPGFVVGLMLTVAVSHATGRPKPTLSP